MNTPGALTQVGPTANPNGFFLGAGDFGPGGAAAGFMYILDSDAAASALYTMSLTTGALTLVGPSVAGGGETWAGMAYDATTGNMYANATVCGTSSSLYTINLATGAPTLVGPMGALTTCSIALAADGAGQLYAYDIVANDFGTVNKVTGAYTPLGPIGFDANYGQGLDYDDDSGVMYMAAYNNTSGQAELRMVNTANGSSVLVGPLGTPGVSQLGFLGIVHNDDCNSNGIPDANDIAAGTSDDCNTNGVPDECESDCNSNGIADECDIETGTSDDCNTNGVPDECEPDCNSNGIADECELDSGGGPCTTPDAVITVEIMTDRFPLETTWDLVEQGVGVVASGGPYYPGSTLYTTNVPVCSTSCYDFTIFDSDGICCNFGSGFYNVYYDGNLAGSGGEFDSSETVSDIGAGCGAKDCQPNGILDECEPDCDGSGIPDDCESTDDCDGDGTLDMCDPDCNTNGISDVCELIAVLLYKWDDGTHENSLGITEGASICAIHAFTVLAGAETITSVSLTWGNTPDGAPAVVYVWSDPNGDGNPSDGQVIASAATVVANADTDIFNDVPVGPVLVGSAGTSFFVGFITDSSLYPAALDENGTLAHQSWIIGDTGFNIDPNNLGGAYPVPLANLDDINFPANFMIRAVSDSTAQANDCNTNGIPDECEPDCNTNGIADECDITAGTSDDLDTNGIPDECEPAGDCGVVSMESCFNHGGACGVMCLPIDCTNCGSVEPRLQLGVPPTLVLDLGTCGCDSASVVVSCAPNTYGGSATVNCDGSSTATVTFSGPLPDRSCCTLAFSGDIVDVRTLALLEGDVNRDCGVSASDTGSTEARVGRITTDPLGGTPYDVNRDCSIAASDFSSVSARVGRVVPPCPCP